MPLELIANRDDATKQLRYILNELRAMDSAVRSRIDPKLYARPDLQHMPNEELVTDRASVIDRLRALAGYLERSGEAPDARWAIAEAYNIPIQR